MLRTYGRDDSGNVIETGQMTCITDNYDNLFISREACVALGMVPDIRFEITMNTVHSSYSGLPRSEEHHWYALLFWSRKSKILRFQHGSKNVSSKIIIGAGDFNLPDWDWKFNTLKQNTQYPNIHHRFTDILDDNGLTQIVEEPNYHKLPHMFSSGGGYARNISDHDIVYTELELIPSRTPDSTV